MVFTDRATAQPVTLPDPPPANRVDGAYPQLPRRVRVPTLYRASRPAATRAGRPTQADLAMLVGDRLRALLDAAGYRLDAAVVAAAVGQSFAGGHHPGRRSPGAAAITAAFTRLTRTASPQALCVLFAGLGSLCAELDLGPQALAAYRRALPYSLDTHDPVVIGTVRGTLIRLALNDRRRVRAARRAGAVADLGSNG